MKPPTWSSESSTFSELLGSLSVMTRPARVGAGLSGCCGGGAVGAGGVGGTVLHTGDSSPLLVVSGKGIAPLGAAQANRTDVAAISARRTGRIDPLQRH